MNTTPKEFKPLLAELQKIREHLKDLRDAIQEHKTSTANAVKAWQQREQPAPHITTVLNLPQALKDAIAKYRDKGTGWERASVIISGATAFFTLLAFAAAAVYACIASSQLKQMIESNTLNRGALVSVQRAFVFVKDFDVSRKSDNNGQLTGGLRFAFHWENGGATPTNNMTSLISYKWYLKTPPLDFWHSEYGRSQGLFVGPKSVTRSVPIDVPYQDIQHVHDRKGHSYFWGWAKYRDTFSGTPEHITRFCYELTEVNGDPLTNPNLNIQTASCERGNCADEECKESK
jgi:hypothetical protein